MKKLLFCSVATLSVLLTACGGGGGGTAQTPDGTKIDLTNSPKGDVGANTAGGKFYGKNQNDSFYGVWINDAKTVRELRYQGTEATQLPSGSATYVGESYWVSGTSGEVSKGGKTTLNVNFDRKTVDGKIEYSLLNDGRVQDITLHPTALNGKTFTGEASTLLQQGTYEGGLFGREAKEAAGLVKFPNAPSYDTSFGGIRY
ncbi:TPA: factor H binding protein domain-containing protein [Mannheimia haemolytica]